MMQTWVTRSPIFYGWVVWGVATLGVIMTSPGQSFSVSLFTDHFINDFGLSRTEVSGLYGTGTFLAAFILTWVGKWVDRHGTRVMGVAISGLFVLALLGLSVAISPIMLLIGFISIRGFGQGSLMLISNTAVTSWFRRLRGRMLSFTFVGFALFQSVYVPAVERLIDAYDWRTVWVMLGVMVGVTILPMMLLLMRDIPEHFGLRPDGDAIPEANDDKTPLEEISWTLRQAQGTPIFWVFALGLALSPAWVSGIIFHQVSLFEKLGHDSATVASTYSILSVVTAVMTLLAGVLMDRVKASRVLAAKLLGLIATLFLAQLMTTSWLLVLYAITMGFTMGIMGVFNGAVWPNLFGRAHQGAIRGFVMMIFVGSTSIGPILFGWSFDTFGSYNAVISLGIAIAIIPLVLSFWVKEPNAT